MAAIAGCSGDGGDGTPTETVADTPEPTTEEPTTEEAETTEEPEKPDPTATENALIEPATYKEWYDAGIVNTDDPYEDRVTTIRVDTDGYDGGHVPGAVKWASADNEGPAALTEAREEGLAKNTKTMIIRGSVVDEIIQGAGVGPNTVVVLTGAAPMRIARAYWTLRFWGFPRERVKVLNGGPTAYKEDYTLSYEEPSTPDINYTVEAFEEPNYDLREGLNEMIQLVDQKNAGEIDDAFLDLRGPGQSATLAGTTADPPATYLQADSFTADAPWADAQTIEDHVFGLEGVSDGKHIVTYCGSGYRAAMAFFALDGILGYDNVSLYDGSFSRQWQYYNGEQNPVPNDAWRVDTNDRTNGEITATDLAIDPDLNENLTELAQLDSNQVKKAAIEYVVGSTSGDFGCGS